jgi:hypothetical protein
MRINSAIRADKISLLHKLHDALVDGKDIPTKFVIDESELDKVITHLEEGRQTFPTPKPQKPTLSMRPISIKPKTFTPIFNQMKKLIKEKTK